MESLEVTEKILFYFFYDQEKALRDKCIFTPPKTEYFVKQFEKEYGISQLESTKKEKVQAAHKNYIRLKKSKAGKYGFSDLVHKASADVLFESVLSEDVGTSTEPEAKRQKQKHLDELDSKKQLRNRTDNLFKAVEEFASDENIPVSKLLGYLLSRSTDDPIAKSLGDRIWQGKHEISDQKLPVETSLAVYTDCSLGRKTYTKLKKIVDATGHKIFPAWKHLREKQALVTPEISMLPDPFIGVYFCLSDAIKSTAVRILTDKIKIPEDMLMKIKFGFDGSGSHPIFKQRNNVKTNNIILTMFCPLLIQDGDGQVLWTEPSPNAPLSQRPLSLQMGKESSESLQSQTVFNDDIKTLKDNGLNLILNNSEVNLKVNIQSFMLDRKAADLYQGLGGAYCDLCDHSKDDCLDITLVESGFSITRSIESLNAIFNELETEDGTVLRQKDDYSTRKGLTKKPIASHDVLSVQVLHALLRCFDHFMKTVIHIHAGVFTWSESKSSCYNRFLTDSKQQMQTSILQSTGIPWDFPDPTGEGGTTTTGNIARRLLHVKSNRDIIVNSVSPQYVSVLSRFARYLSIILRVMSSNRKVNVEAYRKLCTEFNVFLLCEFPRQTHKQLPGPWISITPSLHKVVAHSWELIQLNNTFGLGNLDESGLEGNNKLLRAIRIKLSRKTNQFDNLEDTLRRMWIQSDPVVNIERCKSQPFCQHCQTKGHSTRYCSKKHMSSQVLEEEDSTLESLFL